MESEIIKQELRNKCIRCKRSNNNLIRLNLKTKKIGTKSRYLRFVKIGYSVCEPCKIKLDNASKLKKYRDFCLIIAMATFYFPICFIIMINLAIFIFLNTLIESTFIPFLVSLFILMCSFIAILYFKYKINQNPDTLEKFLEIKKEDGRMIIKDPINKTESIVIKFIKEKQEIFQESIKISYNYCPNCGSSIKTYTGFCSTCGKNIKSGKN